MPELPEVETVRRALQQHVPGKRIERILVRDSRLRWPVDETRLQQLVAGQTIRDIKRRAKYLLVEMEQNSTLIMHLGMSGKLLLLSSSPAFDKHDHVIFYFDNGSELRFRDTRRFGMVDAIPPGELSRYPRLVNLGVEPLARGTRAEILYDCAHKLQRPIKNLLMDANFMVGVGNIYANEALFHARIHPQTPAAKLSSEDWQTLLASIRKVLRKAIRKGGTTLTDFVDSNGEMGYFQLSLAVYGRDEQPCLVCGSGIVKKIQVGRSTYFCPECQVMKEA